jgi:hypothetical protein
MNILQYEWLRPYRSLPSPGLLDSRSSTLWRYLDIAYDTRTSPIP